MRITGLPPSCESDTCTDMRTLPMTIKVYFNPACSKCRQVRALLEARGVDAIYREYLTAPPSRAELESLLSRLGTGDPRTMMRTGDPLYRELARDRAPRHELLDLLVEHPQLLERPIIVVGDRAVVGRPPEKVLELLAGSTASL